MIALTFKEDGGASDCASELLELHNKTQICYEYKKDREIEFWWLYQTDLESDERTDEEEDARKAINSVFAYLDEKGIEYE